MILQASCNTLLALNTKVCHSQYINRPIVIQPKFSLNEKIKALDDLGSELKLLYNQCSLSC
jgi:hypothetical protein